MIHSIFAGYRSLAIGGIFFFCAIVWPHSLALAVSASPHPFNATQPDGTEVALHIRGNEYLNWMEDPKGYTVVQESGRYLYAIPSNPSVDSPQFATSSSFEVGKVDPDSLTIPKHLLPPRPTDAADMMISHVAPRATGGPSSVPATGDVRNVVILMRFANHTSRQLPSQADFDVIFNKVGGDPQLAPTGSVRDFYLENSYGIMQLNSTVFAWVDLPNTEAHYADGNSGLSVRIRDAIRDALTLVDSQIDFSQFDLDGDNRVDAISFVHSGYGAEWGGVDADGADFRDRIWSHRWNIPTWTSAEGVTVRDYHINPGLWNISGTDPGRIGVISHETGHFFGLPDLYDTSGAGSGIGSYGLMANSWGFTGDQLNPPHFSAWSKIQLGWVTPTTITAPGTYTVPQTETSPGGVFRIDSEYPAGEYLLIENRQPVGFESTMPQGGLAVWHIDENVSANNNPGFPGQAGWPQNGSHYMVALLQADGNYDLEQGNGRGDAGDLYHRQGQNLIDGTTTPNTDAYQGGVIIPTNNRISDISAAGASMTFTYNGGTPPIPAAETPIGGIIAYAGPSDQLPPNWQLCNGTTVNRPESPLFGSRVPDLRAQFLRGASGTGYPVGSIGGIDTAPSHSHYFRDSDNQVWFGKRSGNGHEGGYSPANRAAGFDQTKINLHAGSGQISSNPYVWHGHIDGRANISGNTGAGGRHDNRPAFTSIHWIIRIY